MSNFDPKSNRDAGLQDLLSQKDLNTVLGTNNIRGSAMRPPVHSIPSDSITKFEQVICEKLDRVGSVKANPSSDGVNFEITIPDDILQIYGQYEG